MNFLNILRRDNGSTRRQNDEPVFFSYEVARIQKKACCSINGICVGYPISAFIHCMRAVLSRFIQMGYSYEA